MDPNQLAMLLQMLTQQQQQGQPQIPNAQAGMPQIPTPQAPPLPQAAPPPQAMQAAPPPPSGGPGALEQMGTAAVTNAPAAAANPWMYLASIIMPTLLQSMFGQKQQFSAPAQVIPSTR